MQMAPSLTDGIAQSFASSAMIREDSAASSASERADQKEAERAPDSDPISLPRVASRGGESANDPHAP